MARLLNPQLFSQHFGIPQADIEKAGLLDPFLNADTKLFIDPMLLRQSGNKLISRNGLAAFRQRMTDIINLLLASPENDGPAWKAAMRLLDLHERRETCLGYGGAGTSGSSRPDTLKAQILDTAREIINLGITNPEIIGLMGIFEEGVGPDTISDLTTNAILPVLQVLTLDFCKKYSVPTRSFVIGLENRELPENPLIKDAGVLLTPKDILRELPVATDWSDIDRVVQHNAMLRQLVNQMVADITKATITVKKKAIRAVALSSAKNFQALFNDLLTGTFQGYDFARDRRSFEALRQLLTSTPKHFPLNIAKPAAANHQRPG